MSSEVATVLVGLVHFHDCAFVNEGLFFRGKSVSLSEIKQCYACRYCQQDSQMRLCQFNEGFVHAEYTRQRDLFFQLIFPYHRIPRSRSCELLSLTATETGLELRLPLRAGPRGSG